MSSLTIKHLWLALALLVYSIATFSAPRIGSRLNHPPTMNGDQVFAGVKNQTLRFVLSGASDVDKNSLSYVLVDSPSSGTLKNCLNNTPVLACEFTPESEYKGTVTFSYKAFDGTSYSTNVNRVTLKIDLENHAPVVGTNQDLSLKNDRSFKFNLSKATDPDGDQIFYKLVSHNGSGTLKNCLSGTSSLECEYVPATGVNETVNITYKVSDGLLESSQVATIKLRIGSVNHAPIMKGDQGFGSTKFTLAGASDEDKDPLTYSLVSPATLPELKNCLNGTSSLNCEYVSIAKNKGPISFTYKANDGKEDSLNISTVKLDVTTSSATSTPTTENHSPQMYSSTEQYVINSKGYSYFTLRGAFDPDGDPLIYKMVAAESTGFNVDCINNDSDLSCRFYQAIPTECPTCLAPPHWFSYAAFDGKEYSKTTVVNLVLDTQIVTGGLHSCLLKDGDVYCWGNNSIGQLGYGNKINIGDNESPLAGGKVHLNSGINLGNRVVRLSAGLEHTCALYDNGNFICWGANDFGQLGRGMTDTIGDDEVPDSYYGGAFFDKKVVQISAGGSHTCALLEDGNVRCWGRGMEGQLGYGNSNHIGDDELPETFENINVGEKVQQISAGGYHTCALLITGKVRCWGSNGAGQLGYGNTVSIGNNILPVTAGDLPLGDKKIIKISAGTAHTCALFENGDVYCWGSNQYGQLGYGHTSPIGDNESVLSAGRVSLGVSATDIFTGHEHTCALLANGKIRCWGGNYSGELGLGNTEHIGDNELPSSANFPNIDLDHTITALSLGAWSTCALLGNDSFKCWGDNSYGQLGYGNKYNIGDNELPSSVRAVDIYNGIKSSFKLLGEEL